MSEILKSILSEEDYAKYDFSGVTVFNNKDANFIPREQYNKVSKELKDVTKELTELKDAKLTDEEKQAKRLEELETQIKASRVQSSMAEAKAIVLNSGFKVEDFEGILDTLVSEDLEKTVKLVTGLVEKTSNIVGQKIDAVKEEVKVGASQLPGTGNNTTPPKITKEQFNKMSVKQQSELYDTDKELYMSLLK